MTRLFFMAVLAFPAMGAEGTSKKADVKVSTEQVEKWIQQLGDVEYGVREAAYSKLVSCGQQFLKTLQKAKEESKDAEIQFRIQELLKQLTRFGVTGTLGAMEKEIIALPLQTKLLKNGTIASTKNFTHGEYGIVEIGMVRIAILNHVRPGHTSGSQMPIKGIKPDRRPRSAGSNTFSFKLEKGRADCLLGPLAFQVIEGELIFGDRKVPLDKKSVVLASEDGKVMNIVAVPQKKDKASQK